MLYPPMSRRLLWVPRMVLVMIFDIHGGSVSSGDVVVLLQMCIVHTAATIWLVEKMDYPAGVATLARWTSHAYYCSS